MLAGCASSGGGAGGAQAVARTAANYCAAGGGGVGVVEHASGLGPGEVGRTRESEPEEVGSLESAPSRLRVGSPSPRQGRLKSCCLLGIRVFVSGVDWVGERWETRYRER